NCRRWSIRYEFAVTGIALARQIDLEIFVWQVELE
ncbi:MAG: hypothetical protein ACI8PD_000887, partial [Nitrospinales bacterium]